MASSDDFSTLRDQAMRRMRQMHASANPVQPDAPPNNSQNNNIQTPNPQPKSNFQRHTASPLSSFFNSLAGFGAQKNSSKSILDELNIDEDKAIIGILIYILYKNGADIKLMLALGYLLI